MSWKPLEGDEFPTLGYTVADWMTEYLAAPDSGDMVEPFMPTQEQLDFLVKLYEIDPVTCERTRHRAVLSRPRGWGKSPFAAAIAIVEALGPVVCDGWDADGQPVGVPWSSRRTPFVYLAATTMDQVINTWAPLLEMVRYGPVLDEYGLDALDSFIALPRGGKLMPITSSATSSKGGKPVCAILDQTETWLRGNGGIKFAQVMRNNATKLGGVTLETPNAYTIGQNSVAELSAKYWDDICNGRIQEEAGEGLLYDHRGASPETDESDFGQLVEALRYVYGDSSDDPRGCVIHNPPCRPGWSPIRRIAQDFYDTSNDPEVMRADFLNIVGAASDSWLTEFDVRGVIDTAVEIGPREPVTLGFDGSEGRKAGIADSTVLIGYAPLKKHLFKVGVWAQEDGPKGAGWVPPKLEIEATLRRFMETHRVVGLYADPSAGWGGDVSQWEANWGRRMVAKIPGPKPMHYPQRQVSASCDGFAQLRSAIMNREVTIDGSPEIIAHFLNARRDPRRAGYVLKKPDDDQDYSKIDAAWGAMFAYRAGMDAIAKGLSVSRGKWVPRRLN